MRKRGATNTAGPVEGGDLNTRYEIEPMGRVRRMQISPITHAGYFAVIIAVHARGRISYDGEFRGYPSRLEKFAVKYCPLNPEPAGRSYFCNTSTAGAGCTSSPTSTTPFYCNTAGCRDTIATIIDALEANIIM